MRQTLTVIGLILAIVGLGLQVAGAISQDVWGKAWRDTIILALMSVAAFIVIIPAMWMYYLKREAVEIWTFGTLALVAIAILVMAWRLLRLLAQATSS